MEDSDEKKNIGQRMDVGISHKLFCSFLMINRFMGSFFKSIFSSFTGVSVGSGWQGIIAYVNITCYYIIGIPVGIILGYVLGLHVKV